MTSENSRASVIVLGIDTPIGLAVIRDLSAHGYRVIGLGSSVHSLGSKSRHCHRFAVRAPRGEALIAQLNHLAAQETHAFLLAISESDLLFLNHYRDGLSSAVVPLIPDDRQLESVLDKAKTIALANAVGIATPQSHEIASLGEIPELVGRVEFPVVMKWADPNEVAPLLHQHGLPMEKCEYALNAKALQACLSRYEAIGRYPIVQEYCPGYGLGHMFLVDRGKVHLEFQHRRVHEWPPEGGVSSMCEAVPLEWGQAARAKSRQLVESMQWTGVAMVEYRYDPDKDSYKLMEINGRFWGSLPLARWAGVPFAAGLVAVCGEKRTDLSWNERYSRFRCLFAVPETRRLLRVLLQADRIADPNFVSRPLTEIQAYLGALLSVRTRYYVWDRTDPLPMFRDFANMLAKLFRR